MIEIDSSIYTDFSYYLKSELDRRISNNSAYSLRSFAKYLKMSPTSKLYQTSQVLSLLWSEIS